MKRNGLCCGDERNYPVLICDSGLFVVDHNDAAKEKGLDSLLFTNISGHLSMRDAQTLRAFLIKAKNGSKETQYTTIELKDIKGGKVAFVTSKCLFDKYFLELALFRSNTAVLSDSNPLRFMLPGNEYPAEYYLTEHGATVEDTALKLNHLYASNMLTTLYMKASSPKDRIEPFDAIPIIKTMITRVNSLFDMTDSTFTYNLRKGSYFICKYLELTDFINLLSLILVVLSGISETKKVVVSVESEEDTLKVFFDTEAKKPKLITLCDFCLINFDSAYPEYSSYIHIIRYFCDLFGLRFYCDIEGENSFTGELLITTAPPDDEIVFMHPKEVDIDKLFDDAAYFISLLSRNNE